MTPFTIDRFVEGPETGPVDLLIIGGGITGAATAYEAALRGLRVAMVEANDFGAATSAATGKLIHGGLRYLKQGEIGLVRESLRERRILSNIAPNLIDTYPIVLPDADLLMRLGLSVYDVLSFDRNRVLDPAKRIPRHRRAGSGLRYHDCLMISPERLTLAFVRSAAAAGALVANHTRADELLTDRSRVVGARVRDVLTGKAREIRARKVLNATGPWASDFAGEPPEVRSEGIYLITRQLTDEMTLHVTAHGHFSIAPWRGHSMIGPTEKAYRGSASDWRVTAESVDEFLAQINATQMVPHPLGRADVLHVYGGLRPLTESVGEDTYNATRSTEITDHGNGLITAAGGKFTTSRRFAEQLMSTVGADSAKGLSARRPLHGCDTGPIEAYLAQSVRRNGDFAPETVRCLARHHGSEHDHVLELARERPELAEAVDADGEILAQAVVAARHESARTLADVVLRRTGIGTLGHPGSEVLARVTEVVGEELGWDEYRRTTEVAVVDDLLTLPWNRP